MRSWPSRGLPAHIQTTGGLDSSPGEVNEEDLPQMKGLHHGVRHGDPHASSKVTVMGSGAECVEAQITSEGCGRVDVAPAESVKKNSPDVPSVLHKMEPQKPRVTPLRLPVEGGPYKCECEWEAAKIVGMAEGTGGTSLLNKMAVLDGQLAMMVCGVDEGHNSTWKSAKTPASAPT